MSARIFFCALAVVAFVSGILVSGAWAAQPVALRAALSDEDGKITLGELFDGAGGAAGVVVSRVTPGASAVLDAAQIQRIALAQGLSWSNPAGLRRIIVRPGASVAAEGRQGAVDALTYTRNLNTGEVVGPDDLAWTKVVAAPANAPRDAAFVIGKAAKRPLRSGASVASSDVTAPLVIKKDDMVQVTWSDGGVSLTLEAKALQGAAAGDTLNVVNPASKKIIQTIAVAAGQAAVGPSAIQYRTQPGQLASLR